MVEPARDRKIDQRNGLSVIGQELELRGPSHDDSSTTKPLESLDDNNTVRISLSIVVNSEKDSLGNVSHLHLR